MPGVILVMLAFSMWNSHESSMDRVEFETEVAKQHMDMHQNQQDMKQYIDVKAADRFTGTQGRIMSERIEAVEDRVEWLEDR